MPERFGGGRQHGGEGGQYGAAGERDAAFHGRVHGGPQGPQVAFGARSGAVGTLGSHVGGRADDYSRLGETGVLIDGAGGQPEVGQNRVPVIGEQDVGGFDVTVHDAGRVGGLQRRQHLQPDACDGGNGQTSFHGDRLGEAA